MMQGRIIKGVGGLYTVRGEAGDSSCRARGLFRLQKVTPTVGDLVEYEPSRGEEEGFVTTLLPRKNVLKRPAVANVDLNVIVIAAGEPQPDLLLVDRLLAQAVELGLEAALCVNKADQADAATLADYRRQYRHLAQVFTVSREQPESLETLRKAMAGKTTCLSGQSGVGKSTLINALTGRGETMEVGSISERTRRGRHTTRHAELLALPEGGYVVDTPGFSLLEMDLMDPGRLAEYYPDFAPYADRCRFIGCLHEKEPDCAVKAAVAADQVDDRRYRRYCLLLQDMKERWRSRYD